MDDLLPAYAKVLDEVCPCSIDEFDEAFNNALKKYLPESQRIKKTLDNHRTEISGKLFGMYYRSDDGMIYESERTQKFLEDNDQPAFFKDICYKMQFPNGMDKAQTLQERISEKIMVRPNAFVLKFLQTAESKNIEITVKDIGYYVLNSLDVLQGHADPDEIISVIQNDRQHGIVRVIKAYDDDGNPKASSYTYQHIREQLNYLELANLIRIIDGRVLLNARELEAIDAFTSEWNKTIDFDVYSFDLSTVEKRKKFQSAWDYYFSRLSDKAKLFDTSVEALIPKTTESDTNKKKSQKTAGINLVEFGDEGEALVFEYEKKRVAAYSPRLANKVIPFGKTRGLGYDLQSIIAEQGEEAEFCKYIEVKSTKRFTCPDPDNPLWVDTVNITRNEWVAALQHQKYYSIYRVYFTKDGITMFVMNNVAKKKEDSKITVTPMTYRLDFTNSSVDAMIPLSSSEGEDLEQEEVLGVAEETPKYGE